MGHYDAEQIFTVFENLIILNIIYFVPMMSLQALAA